MNCGRVEKIARAVRSALERLSARSEPLPAASRGPELGLGSLHGNCGRVGKIARSLQAPAVDRKASRRGPTTCRPHPIRSEALQGDWLLRHLYYPIYVLEARSSDADEILISASWRPQELPSALPPISVSVPAVEVESTGKVRR